MSLSHNRQGELIIFFESLLWSLFPIVTISLYQHISPLFTLALSALFALIFFGIILLFKKQWNDFKNKQAVWDIVRGSFFLAIFWFFTFTGLKYTNSGNASIVLLMEIFFSYLFFGLWKKEKQHLFHIIGAIIMAIGAIIILFPGELQINKGDLFILIGTIFPGIGNYFQQKARTQINSYSLLFIRNLVSTPFWFIIAFTSGQTIPTIIDLQTTFPLFLFSGIFLFGLSKILWIEGIHRIPLTKAISLTTITPAFTLIFAYFILNEIPTIWQILGFFPILIGGILITKR